MQDRILVVEDEADVNRLLARILQKAGYQVLQAFSGTEAKLLMEKEMPDLILLDLMLPGLTGEEFLEEIREQQHLNVPVLILSAKDSLKDKVTLLKSGADDYITKPFEPEEVVARVQASLRRSKKVLEIKKGAAQGEVLTHKKLALYPAERKAVLNQRELLLTAHEFDILLLLMQNPGKVYSRESLYELVWQGGYYGENNTVNVHVSNLRKKIKEAGDSEEYIRTVYGIGFKLAEYL